MSARGVRLVSAAAFAAVLAFAGVSSAQEAGPIDSDGGVTDGGARGEGDGGVGGDGGVSRRRAKARPIPPELLPTVEAKLGAEQIELGERLPLTIEIRTKGQGDRVHLREAKSLGDFELLDRHRREGGGEGQPDEVFELQLITFEVGQLEVPPIELMVVLPDGRTGAVSTGPLSVRVTDPLGNEPDPTARGDHEPRAVMTTDRRALWIGGVLAAMLLAALLGAILARVRERKRPEPPPPPKPKRPAEEVAFEKLEEIKRSDMLAQGLIKAFHVAVSEAIREYLGGRYGFDSLEMTTEELIENLELVSIRGVTETELRRFLRETDMVKFAKWRPEDEKSREILDQAFAIVRRTTEAHRAQEIRESIKVGDQKAKAAREEGGDEES